MPICEKTLRAYEVQLRRIEEHRLKNAEKNIRRIYQALRKDLIAFLAMEYANNAEDDVLTFDVLYGKGRYARFLEETEKHIDSFTPETRAEITSLVNNTYKAVYAGLVDAVIKTKKVSDVQKELESVKAVRPEVLRRAVLNPVSGLTLPDRLEKRRREIIYDIKQQVGIGLSYGDRYSTIAKRISDSCEFNYTKAIRVARTESRRVLEMGLDDSANEIDTVIKNGSSGLIGVKTWRTMKDERVRPQRRVKTKSGWKTYKSKPNAPNHVKMEGQTVLTNELFDLGSGVKSKAPLQSGVAGHDINCRCFIEHDWLTPEEYAEVTGKKYVDNSAENGIINTKDSKIMSINNIDSPIEQRNTGKGNPNAILHLDRPLNNRQQKLLDQLPSYDSSVTVRKKSVNMRDLAAITAQTGDEFAMFTKGGERLVIRGDSNSVNVDIERAKELSKQGYKWSGHTHPGVGRNCLMASRGDKDILRCFKQEVAYIYNSQGSYLEFGKE